MLCSAQICSMMCSSAENWYFTESWKPYLSWNLAWLLQQWECSCFEGGTGGKLLHRPSKDKRILCFNFAACCSDLPSLRSCGYCPNIYKSRWKLGSSAADPREMGRRRFCAGDLAIEHVGNKLSLGRKRNVFSCNKITFLPLLCKVSRERRCFKPEALSAARVWHWPDSSPLHQLTVTLLLLGDRSPCAIKRPRAWPPLPIKPPRRPARHQRRWSPSPPARPRPASSARGREVTAAVLPRPRCL